MQPTRNNPPPCSYGFGEKIPAIAFHTPNKVHQLATLTLLGMAAATLFSVIVSPFAKPLNIDAKYTFPLACVIALVIIVKKANRSLNHYTPPTNSLKLTAENYKCPPLGQFIDNHKVFPTKDGKESHKWKIKLLNNAKQSIEISGGFCAGALFRQVLDKIRERLQVKPNLKVHIISNYDLLDDLDYKAIDELKRDFPNNFKILITKTRIDLCPYNRINNHVKLFIIDEEFFIFGSSSTGDRFCHKATKPISRSPSKGLLGKILATSFREMDLVGKGELAKTLRLEFFKLFALWEQKMALDTSLKLNNYYFPLNKKEKIANIEEFDDIPTSRLKIVVGSPESYVNACQDEYINNLKAAKKTIRIANLFFHPSKLIKNEIKKALDERNVKMQIITNGLSEKSPKQNLLFFPCCRKNYLSLMDGKIKGRLSTEIFEWDVLDGAIHVKAFRGDDNITSIDSFNLYKISLYSDHEIMGVVDSKFFAKQVDKILDKDIEFCKQVTLEEARKYRKYIFLRRMFGKIFQLSS